MLINQPKYILSVFGVANAGKSTLLTQLMQNLEEMMELYKKAAEDKKTDKPIIFPSNTNPLTYYDTFYSFHKEASQIETC